MTPLTFYRQQAAKEQDAADAAVLANARDRSLRAVDAWTKLASQIEHTDELRAKRQEGIDAGELSSGSNENPDRGRASSSRDSNTSTKLAAQCAGGENDG